MPQASPEFAHEEMRTRRGTDPISRRLFLKRASLAAVGLVTGYPVLVERYLVGINSYRIPVPHLPPAFAGLRIVQLTDLHYGLLVPLALIEDVVERANAAAPDLIVCTGDYVHARETAEEIDAVWPLLGRLRAPLGVYSVLGNHDHWADAERSRYWLQRTGQDLGPGAVCLERSGERLWLAGAGDLWEDHRNLDGVLADVPDGECRIVAAHNPDTADMPRTRRVDLMLCGHTHGGQVALPLLGAPILPVKNKDYSSGLKHSPSGCPVFISRGIGWAIAPVRFNCAPEIAVLELVPQNI